MRQVTSGVWFRAASMVLVGAVGTAVWTAASPVQAYTATANGYVCRDGEEANGPAFSWDDLSSSGTAVPWTAIDASVFDPADEGTSVLQIPFPYTYFGTSYTAVTVCTNGFLRFGTGTLGTTAAYSNPTIPSTALPNAVACPFWEDLDMSTGSGAGTVKWELKGSAPNRRLVVSWLGVAHFIAGPASSSFTFQVALYEQGGGIRFQYKSMTSTPATYASGLGATIGIENGTGTAGLLYAYGTGSTQSPSTNNIYDGLSVGYYVSTSTTPPWALKGPQTPVSLIQAPIPNGGAGSIGFTDGDGSLSLRADVSHTDATKTVAFQVEVKPNGTAFDGSGLVDGNTVPGSGGTSEAQVTGLADGSYHWRGRTIEGTNASGWEEYDSGTNPDFIVQIGYATSGGKEGKNGNRGINDRICKSSAGTGPGSVLWLLVSLGIGLAARRRR